MSGSKRRNPGAGALAKASARIIAVVIAWHGLCAGLWAQPLVSSADVFRKVSPSVGRLVALDAKGEVMGGASTFVVDKNGLVVTNYHCLVDKEDGWVAHALRVELPGRAPYTVEGVVSFSAEKDWAILKIPASGLLAVQFGDAAKVEKGEPVVAIGYPAGLDARPTSGAFSGWLEDEILHDASISSGNSGGPLLDREGKVIGITRGELRSRTGMVALNDLFFAVDIKHIRLALSKPATTLTKLPVVSPESLRASGVRQTPGGVISVPGGDSGGGGGHGTAIVLGVLGAGAATAGAIVLTQKAVDAIDSSGEIARFSGTLAACSSVAHQFVVRELTNASANVTSMSPGANNLSGYGFLGACNGQASYTNTFGSERNLPVGCGFGSTITQFGGCTPLWSQSRSLFLNNLPPGTHTVAIHNFGQAATSYELVINKLF